MAPQDNMDPRPKERALWIKKFRKVKPVFLGVEGSIQKTRKSNQSRTSPVTSGLEPYAGAWGDAQAALRGEHRTVGPGDPARQVATAVARRADRASGAEAVKVVLDRLTALAPDHTPNLPGLSRFPSRSGNPKGPPGRFQLPDLG